MVGERIKRRTLPKVACVLLAVGLVAPVALPVSTAGAATPALTCQWSGSITFSPPLAKYNDPAKSQTTITGTETFTGCAGSGITSGAATFNGASIGPQNCDSAIRSGNPLPITGTDVVTWNTGQTSSWKFFPFAVTVSSGLFAGATIDAGSSFGWSDPTLCNTPLSSAGLVARAPLTLTLPAVKGPTCKTLVAPGKFVPPLPPLTSKVTVTSKLSAAGKIGGCTGGGVTGGTTRAVIPFKGNCLTLLNLSQNKHVLTGSGSITWNTNAVSNFSITAKLVSKFGVQPLLIQLTISITSGLFAGTSTTFTVKGTAPSANAGITSPLGAFTLAGNGHAHFA